jgi:hypothetical protein
MLILGYCFDASLCLVAAFHLALGAEIVRQLAPRSS